MTSENELREAPCKWCGETTTAFGTQVCNACWEVTSRLERFMRSKAGRNEVRRLIANAGAPELRLVEDIAQQVVDRHANHHYDLKSLVAEALRKDRILR